MIGERNEVSSAHRQWLQALQLYDEAVNSILAGGRRSPAYLKDLANDVAESHRYFLQVLKAMNPP
jgi:hypothetical protein